MSRARAAAALLLATQALAAAPQQPRKFTYEKVHFGNIPVELTLYADDAETADAAAQAAFARVAELSAMMNDYAFEPPSPLNRIAAESPQAVAVPDELFAALERAVAMHAITDGAFDVTAKPFVQMWRSSRKVGKLPPKHRLANARRYVDVRALVLDGKASTAQLKKQGMWLDLGGLAKGMIGDEVVALLKARGVARCRYRAGGDMVFGDAPPGEQGWRVTVPDLLVGGADQQRKPLTFVIANGAASVSGDVYRFVEIDGVRYAHVIDPRTGLGVTDRRVTCVRGKRGVDTDPLATAGLILDDDAWRKALAKVPGSRGDRARVQN